MYFIAVACVVNIALDFFLIGGLHMGAAGAALGTTLSQTVSVLVALAVIFRGKSGITIDRNHFHLNRKVMGSLLKIGTPVAVQDGFIQIAFLVITMQLAPEPFIGLFTHDSEVIRMGAQYMHGYVFDCILAGIHFCFSGYFCAYGKSWISFMHNAAAILCARIPLAYLASVCFPDTLLPMGLATSTGSLLSVIVCIIFFIWMDKVLR